MTANDVIVPTRRQLSDTTADADGNYRWSNTALAAYLTEAMRQVRELRPDAQVSATGGLSTFAAVTDATNDSTVLCVPDRWLPVLMDYIAYRAFSEDADDTNHAARAVAHKEAYDAGVGL